MVRALFLVSDDEASQGAWCAKGEPVIPGYPSSPVNTFLGVHSGKPCRTARVEAIDEELDGLHRRLCEGFPGLPAALHRAYTVETAVACARIGAGKKVRLVATYDTADLIASDGVVVRLWDKQPL